MLNNYPNCLSPNIVFIIFAWLLIKLHIQWYLWKKYNWNRWEGKRRIPITSITLLVSFLSLQFFTCPQKIGDWGSSLMINFFFYVNVRIMFAKWGAPSPSRCFETEIKLNSIIVNTQFLDLSKWKFERVLD